MSKSRLTENDLSMFCSSQLIFSIPPENFLVDVLSHLSPYEIERMKQVNKKIYYLVQQYPNEYQILWKNKFEQYFPHVMDQAEDPNRNWRDIFWKTFDSKYKSLTKDEIELIVHIQERNTDAVINRIQICLRILFKPPFMFTIRQNPKNQDILDEVYKEACLMLDRLSGPFDRQLVIPGDPIANTRLHWALLCRQPQEKIQTLINDGWNINTMNNDTISPLCLAALNVKTINSSSSAMLDLFKKTDLNTVEWSWSQLSWLIVHGVSYEVLKYIIDNFDGINYVTMQTAVFHACRFGKLELLTYLVRDKRIVWDKNEDLDQILKLQNIHSANKLFASSLTVDTETLNIALHLACENGSKELVQLLIEKGADVNSIQFGFTPLIQSIHNKDITVFEMLIQNEKTNVNLRKFNEAALDNCIRVSSSRKTNFILDTRKDLNLETLSNVLELSCKTRDFIAFENILNHILEKHPEDFNIGFRVLDEIIFKKNNKFFKLIENKKINVDERDNNNLRILDIMFRQDITKYPREHVEFLLKNTKLDYRKALLSQLGKAVSVSLPYFPSEEVISNIKYLCKLKEYEFNPNSDGNTLLHHVILHKKYRGAICLINTGTNSNLINLKNKTPYDLYFGDDLSGGVIPFYYSEAGESARVVRDLARLLIKNKINEYRMSIDSGTKEFEAVAMLYKILLYVDPKSFKIISNESLELTPEHIQILESGSLQKTLKDYFKYVHPFIKFEIETPKQEERPSRRLG